MYLGTAYYRWYLFSVYIYQYDKLIKHTNIANGQFCVINVYYIYVLTGCFFNYPKNKKAKLECVQP